MILLYYCSVTTVITQCIIVVLLCLEQLRVYIHNETVHIFNGSWFLWLLGKGE